jgi:hypothetical protein
VENSWPCATGGPSERDDLSKSRRDLLRSPAMHAVTCGASAHQCAMKRYEAADQMAPHDNAGLVGKASPRTSNVADTPDHQTQKLRPCLP